MKIASFLIAIVLAPVCCQAQDDATNPLAQLNTTLEAALEAAGVPFTEDQEKAVTLMMEEQRRASEELFGDLMDFRTGPTEGQESDRLRSAIEWMKSQYLDHLGGYLTDGQAAAWREYRETTALTGSSDDGQAPTETQYVRINNNGFTAEDANFSRSGSGTEVIQRGGAGSWHGNTQFLLKDDALNSRNVFADNKPPYQERRLSLDVSGPVIPARLTSTFEFNQRESENVTTVRATRPDGVFALGITRPNTFRSFTTSHTLQLADSHSLRASARISSETARDQGIGGFTLPERAYRSTDHESSLGVRHFSALSASNLLETHLQQNRTERETTPGLDAVRINVLDAFNSGGAQNRSSDRNRVLDFGTLYTHAASALTLKMGVEGFDRRQVSESRSNTGGTFTFSSLDAYLAGTPLTYRVTRGEPLVRTSQLEMAGFLQADITLSSRLTMMMGGRYEAQQNLSDYNNFAPRVALAYAPSPATVLRAGAGIFYNRLTSRTVENQRRFDGSHQYEIVIDHPSYPDPFGAGTIRQNLQSLRVTSPTLEAPRFTVAMISVERTFLSNLLFTGSYDYQRERHKLLTRNLNAPYDATAPLRRACSTATPEDACIVPDPSRGNIISLESTGNDVRHTLRLRVSKRFDLVNASLTYEYRRQYSDVQGGEGSLVSDSYDLRRDWGSSSNPRHQVNATVNARLPMGLFVTGTMAFNSRRLYTMTTGLDDNRDSNVNDRPAGVEPNSLEGPRYFNVDLNLSKAFFFSPNGGTSGTNANVFVNVTNAFNRVHYGTPSGVLTSPNFGRSTSARDPREVEVGVRFQF